MRLTTLTALILAATALAGCMTTRSDGSPQVQTTGQANRESLEGAASAPLRDLNVLRTKIPDVLLQAMADPYQRPPSTRCQVLANLIRPLDGALGADLDKAPADEDDLLGQGREGALGAAATLATGVIPFRGWVRQLSGAERHDRLVQAAITAGAVRRAYLKGLGESKGCAPPATPSHELAGREVIRQDFKPRYPTRLSEPAPGTPAGKTPAAPQR
jgi:predicted small secreted protein